MTEVEHLGARLFRARLPAGTAGYRWALEQSQYSREWRGWLFTEMEPDGRGSVIVKLRITTVSVLDHIDELEARLWKGGRQFDPAGIGGSYPNAAPPYSAEREDNEV